MIDRYRSCLYWGVKCSRPSTSGAARSEWGKAKRDDALNSVSGEEGERRMNGDGARLIRGGQRWDDLKGRGKRFERGRI